jgi:replicative DNA helicase
MANTTDATAVEAEGKKMSSKLMDVGAERAVLAGLFSYGIESYVEVCDLIDHKTFGHQNNQVLYKCLEKVLQDEVLVDIPAILAAASQLGLSDAINTKQELEYIKSLMEFPVKKNNVVHFASQIKKFEFARKIKSLAAKIGRDVDEINGDENIDEIIGLIENPIMEFLREDETNSKPEKLGDGIEEYLDFLINNECDQIGVATGFPRFDAVIGGGLRRKCVDLVSARPGVGKSVFADNVALNVASRGIPVLMLDTEMSKEDHLNRIIANLTNIPINDISTGKALQDEEKFIKIKAATEQIKEMPYTYVTVSGAPFETIINTIKRWIMQEVGTDENGQTNECLVIYDYLKLMSSSAINNNIQEYQALGFQITSLHNLAVKYDFPCLSFVQLNRDGITKESTDAVSGSDRLIWLCTSFSIFKLKSVEELAEDGPRTGNRKLVTLKARHGAGLMDGNYINMKMYGEHSKLEELRTRDEFIIHRETQGAIEGSELPFDDEEEA